MKSGKTIIELATELDRQAKAKKDYIADSKQIIFDAEENTVDMRGVSNVTLKISETAHRQIGTRLDIPRKFYQRLRETQPELLTTNVNTLLYKEPKRTMLRTLDGTLRAVLSDRYKRIDNFDLMQAILPTFQELGNDLRVESTEVTDNKLYIKALFPKIESEIAEGDVVQAGIMITNSEVGAGAFRIEKLVYRLVCSNGLIAPGEGTRKYHIGRQADANEAAYEMYQDDTLRADDQAFWLKIRDVVRNTFNPKAFENVLGKMREATGVKIENAPSKAVEQLSNRVGFTDKEQDLTLSALLSGAGNPNNKADFTKWGLVNAVTFASQQVESYDRATEMERIGGELLNIPKEDWAVISK